MVVGDDRQRYIAFVIEGGKTDRGNMIGAIRHEFSKDEYENIKPWLTVFEGDRGIIRCKHTGKEKALNILNKMQVGGGKVKTIMTSGTIKKAKRRLDEYE